MLNNRLRDSGLLKKEVLDFHISKRKVNEGYLTTRLMGRYLTPKGLV
jgi:hypothetical protein